MLEENQSTDALVRFENSFHTEIKEKLFLVKNRMGSPVKSGGYFLNGARYIACVDCNTGELQKRSGTIRWMYKYKLFHKQEFSRMGIYRVQVREGKTNPRDNMIVKILGKADDPQLNAVREEYLIPVVEQTEFGTFELIRDYDNYEGIVNVFNQDVTVTLGVNEGETDITIPLQHLKQIVLNQEKFDAMIKQYIAQDETLWDWLEDSDTPREGFEKTLPCHTLCIEPDGTKEFFFDGGEPFGGHSIAVLVDQNNTCTGIDLVG